MKFEIGLWGISLSLGKVEIRLFLGDLYINIPSLIEVAWNKVGFVVDRHYGKRGKGND